MIAASTKLTNSLRGVWRQAAKLKEKVSYTAIACLSYIYIQLAPPEPYLKALYKIKIPRILKEAL